MRYPRPTVGLSFSALIVVLALFACASKRPEQLGVRAGRLSPCPSSPNCISSDAAEHAHFVEPFTLQAPAARAWPLLRQAVAELPRTRIVQEAEGYLHAECRSALFGFVDDLELHLRPGTDAVSVRSAARLGHSDFGVNRRRVEKLRRALAAQGLLTFNEGRHANLPLGERSSWK